MRKFVCASFLCISSTGSLHPLSLSPLFMRALASGLQNTKVLLQHLIKADIFIQSVLNKSEQRTAAVGECAQSGGLFNKLGFL